MSGSCEHQYRRDVETCPWCELAEAKVLTQQLAFHISEAMKRIENENIDAAYQALKVALSWVDESGEAVE